MTIDRLFPILGTDVPELIGRAQTMQRMVAALSKPVPSHLQMVGPRYAGKTVVLAALAHCFRQAGSPYAAVVEWDLGHQTPASDEAFMQRLAKVVAAGLPTEHAQLASYLRDASGNPYTEIAEVLDELKKASAKVLLIMDGFDKPLANVSLTRNLWDQMRELASRPSLRLVTASRKTLQDLIRQPDAQTSDFWNIFDPEPVRVGCFDDNDLSVALQKMPHVQLSAGASTELWNWTNGYPVLMLECLNTLKAAGVAGSLSADQMVQVCEDSRPRLDAVIDSLWRDCSPSSRDLFLRLLDEGVIPKSTIVAPDLMELTERGFGHLNQNKLSRPSRLVRLHLDGLPGEGNAIARLFGSEAAFSKNYLDVLARWIENIDAVDASMKRQIKLSLQHLPDDPGDCLGGVHNVLEKVLASIWTAEFGGNKVPENWFPWWRQNNERNFEGWLTRFPEGGERLRLLDLMTGTSRTDRLAKFVTKKTYVLANAVQGFRDFGVHPKGVEIDLWTAYAAMAACIELCATVTRDLRTEAS